MRSALSAGALALLLASSASAQDIELPESVLVFLNQANTADAEQQQMALLEVGNVLRGEGIDFEVEDDATCTGTSNGCLNLAQEEERADAVLILSVYHQGDEGSVDLQVFDGQMSGVGNESWVGDPSAAAGRAMREALESFAPEFVRVHLMGSPEGAAVLVAGQTGELPFIGRLSPGTHRLRVSADGHLTLREDIEVPVTTETWTYQVALEEGQDDPDALPIEDDDDDDDDDDEATESSGRGALIGAGVAGLIAGAGLGVAGAFLLTRDGDCDVDGCIADDGTILPGRDTRTSGVALLVVGGVLLTTGLALTIGGARITPSVSPDGAHLHLHTRF
jgi:hypothetical protein